MIVSFTAVQYEARQPDELKRRRGMARTALRRRLRQREEDSRT